jgi:hypothetical protein
MSLDPMTKTLDAGGVIVASLTVTPPVDAPLGTGESIVDVEAYVNGELLGGFRKLDVPPVPLHKPLEPGYAESEIQAAPLPLQVGRSSWVSATVQNGSEQPMTVELEFGWAQFGMGIPFSTTGMLPFTRSVTLNPLEQKVVGVQWTPVNAGHQCLRVLLHDQAGLYRLQQSQRNVEVEERTVCGEKIYSFTLQNSTPLTVTVSLGVGAFNLPPGWTYIVNPPGPIELGPFESIPIQLIVFVPCPPPLAGGAALRQVETVEQETGGWPTINVEGIADGELLGGIQVQFSPEVELNTLYLPVVRK